MIPCELTHEQRQALIRIPITFRVYGSKGWGGTCTTSEDGQHRQHTPRPGVSFDENENNQTPAEDY